MNIKELLIFFISLTFVSSTLSSDVNQLPSTLEYKLDLRIDYNTKKCCEGWYSDFIYELH